MAPYPSASVLDNLIQADITHMNHTKMDMAVATFFMRILFLTVVLNPLLLRSCSIMPGWWEETKSHWEGGGHSLLDINHRNIVEHNKEVLC